MYFVEIFIIVFLGLVLGSFSTALIYRIPRNMHWVNARSLCTKCGEKLGFFSLFPILSWCFLRGHCKYCNAKISCKYLIVEIASVLLCFIVYYILGFSFETLFIIFSIPFLLSLLVIDIEYMTLPNQLVLCLFVIGLARFVYNLYLNDFVLYYALDYVFGGVVFALLIWGVGALFSKILKREALGFGDVKFFGVAGVWLGLSELSYFLMLSGVAAIVFAVFWRIITKSDAFPFGPSLIMSFYVLLLI